MAPRVLRHARTSVLVETLRVVEEDGVRSLILDDLAQSDCILEPGGAVSLAQPDEHVPLLVLLARTWLGGASEAAAAADMAAAGGAAVASAAAGRVAGGVAADAAAPTAATGGQRDQPGSLLLLCGVGGGNVARCVVALVPSARVHGVELEPEVLQAATDFFGLQLGGRITAQVGEASSFLQSHAAALQARSAPTAEASILDSERAAAPFDVVILDCFSGCGLAQTILSGQALCHAASCLNPPQPSMSTGVRGAAPAHSHPGAPAKDWDVAPGRCAAAGDGLPPCIRLGGLCIVNLHTARGRAAMADPDYAASRKVLRRLCGLFSHVYTLECVGVQNVLAICHQGPDLLDLDEWAALLGEARADPAFATVLGVPDTTEEGRPARQTAGAVPGGTCGGGTSADRSGRMAVMLGGRGVGERALALDSLLDRLEYVGGKAEPPDL